MDKLAKQESCQLFIEQEIDEGLDEGKTPYLIGKEVAKDIEKYFEIALEPKSLMERARRRKLKLSTNVDSDITPPSDRGIEDNQEIKWGGKREGSGRPLKFLAKQEPIAAQWTGDPESYTPAKYIESARRVMGSIDVDPASNDFANKTVKATIYYTFKNTGLDKEWEGNIFLNPPYKQPEMSQFVDKLLTEIKVGNTRQAILLTNNNTDTQWFYNAAKIASVLCFTKGRISFYKADGKDTSPTNGQAFFYFGNNEDKFKQIFSQIGLIFKLWLD